MWLFTPRGFFTVAAVTGANLDDVLIPPEYKDTVNVMVRARVRTDLEGLKDLWSLLWPEPLPPIQHLAHDYPYRMVMPRKRWALLVENMAEEIDYRKFKDAVCKAQGHERYSLYLKVWQVLYDAERKLMDYLCPKPLPQSSTPYRGLDTRVRGWEEDWFREDIQHTVTDPPTSRNKTFVAKKKGR
jgi:hypothetical protein